MRKATKTPRRNCPASLNARSPRATVSRLLRWREVSSRTALSRSGIYRAMETDDFPRPIRLSEDGRAVAWLEEEVMEWIEARIEHGRIDWNSNPRRAPARRARALGVARQKRDLTPA